MRGGNSGLPYGVAVVMRLFLLVPLALVAIACGGAGADETVVYLPAKLGADGPPGQIAPVLEPLKRDRPGPWLTLVDLRAGPSPDEQARGVRAALSPETRIARVDVADGVATVDLAGRSPSFLASAAIAYTLTENRSITAVRLRLNGEPCCVYRMNGSPVTTITRKDFHGWTGEPCALRDETVPRCRS